MPTSASCPGYPPDYQLLRQNQAIPVKLLADHLHAAGYDCSLFFSGFLGDTGLSAFYRTRGFGRIYDAGNMPEAGRNESWLWGVREEHVTGQIKKLLGQLAAKPDKPFFIYYRMLFPHAPFQSISGDPPVFDEEGHQHGIGRQIQELPALSGCPDRRLLEHLDSAGIANSTVVMLVPIMAPCSVKPVDSGTAGIWTASDKCSDDYLTEAEE